MKILSILSNSLFGLYHVAEVFNVKVNNYPATDIGINFPTKTVKRLHKYYKDYLSHDSSVSSYAVFYWSVT